MPGNKNIYSALLLFALAVYIIGMICVPMMEIDAAQYASIAEQMVRQHSYLQINHLDGNYLDKPPLLFRLSVFSILGFGSTGFAYKLPSVLATCLAIYSTYRFTKLYYTVEVAKSSWVDPVELPGILCYD